MLNQIISKKELVKSILHHIPKARDCDKALYACYLKIEIEHFKVTDKRLSDYADSVSKLQISPPESLSRARRRIQNNEGLYIGAKQAKRRAAAQAMKQGINNI